MINKLYKLGAPETGRDDLVAVLLTGVPKLNMTGPKLADVLRLNLTIPVTKSPNRLGVLGGDTQGWPNGRRLGDDVIDIAEQAVGGFLKDVKLPLGDGVNGDDVDLLDAFPYVADPRSGFDNTQGLAEALTPPNATRAPATAPALADRTGPGRRDEQRATPVPRPQRVEENETHEDAHRSAYVGCSDGRHQPSLWRGVPNRGSAHTGHRRSWGGER